MSQFDWLIDYPLLGVPGVQPRRNIQLQGKYTPTSPLALASYIERFAGLRYLSLAMLWLSEPNQSHILGKSGFHGYVCSSIAYAPAQMPVNHLAICI